MIKAQVYKTGIGVRAGTSSGLTIKHFTNKKSAVEALVTTRWQGLTFTGLYELNDQAFDVPNLTWFIGGGAHLGFYNGHHTPWGEYDESYAVLGIDGILGLEYTFKEVPINLGIDWKPSFNLFGFTDFWSEGAISIRYVF